MIQPAKIDLELIIKYFLHLLCVFLIRINQIMILPFLQHYVFTRFKTLHCNKNIKAYGTS